MFGLGMPELMIILLIALLIFGRRLPEVMRSIGSGVSQFKQGMNEVTEVEEPASRSAPPEPTSTHA